METVTNNGKQFKAIHGTTSTAIQFLSCANALSSYTLFHVARYTGLGTVTSVWTKSGSRGRIFASDLTCAPSANWLSGFWFGHSGVAHHEVWITANLEFDSSPSYHGDDWVVSSDSFGLYHSNGVSRVDSGGGSSSLSSLAINKLYEYSDFMVADVILFSTKLSSLQIATIENYLFEIYGIPLPGPIPIMKGDFDAQSAAHATALTYNDMKAICENKGQRLCLSREICDMSTRQVISNELIISTPSEDSWIAVGDKQDEWLTLSRKFNGRYCKTHTEVAGSTPDWSNSTSPKEFSRLVKCCFLPPGNIIIINIISTLP